MTPQRILVTGGAGFIGSHLSRRLIAKGYDVTVVDNLLTGSRDRVPPQATFIQADLTQDGALGGLPDGPYAAICHLAGQSSGEKSFDDPRYDFDANVRSTVALSEWALKQGVPAFLHASSMAVYGQTDASPVSEAVVPQPVSYYGASKCSAEQVLQVAARRGLRACSFRMFSVYGPGQDLGEARQGMVRIYLSVLLRGEPLVVRGSLGRVRDFIYIDDVIDAWELALKRPVHGVFNLGSGRGTSVRELIARMLRLCELDERHPISEAAGTPGDQAAVCADIRAIRAVLGWEPRVALDEGLARMVAWARSLQGMAS